MKTTTAAQTETTAEMYNGFATGATATVPADQAERIAAIDAIKLDIPSRQARTFRRYW